MNNYRFLEMRVDNLGRKKMTQDEFKIKATELIRLMIDAIAEKEYTKLVSTIPPELSWATFDNAEPTAKCQD